MPQSGQKVNWKWQPSWISHKDMMLSHYNITIGFSDLENVGVDIKFVFLSWPKTEIGEIQFIYCGCFWRWSIWISLETVHYKSSFML